MHSDHQTHTVINKLGNTSPVNSVRVSEGLFYYIRTDQAVLVRWPTRGAVTFRHVHWVGETSGPHRTELHSRNPHPRSLNLGHSSPQDGSQTRGRLGRSAAPSALGCIKNGPGAGTQHADGGSHGRHILGVVVLCTGLRAPPDLPVERGAIYPLSVRALAVVVTAKSGTEGHHSDMERCE